MFVPFSSLVTFTPTFCSTESIDFNNYYWKHGKYNINVHINVGGHFYFGMSTYMSDYQDN